MTLEKGWVDVPIDKLDEAEWNYKNNDSDMLIKLANNLKRNKQLETIIIRDKGGDRYEVVNGNHRLKAFRMIEWDKTIHAFNMGIIADTQAKRIAVEVNETRFTSNNDSLAKVIADIAVDFSIEDMTITMPFTEENFIGFIEINDRDEEEEPVKKKNVEFKVDDSHITFQIKVSKEEAMIEDDLKKLMDKYKTAEVKRK